MEWSGIMTVSLQLAAGIGLAACCGLRAFLPPLLVGLAARFGVGDILTGGPIALSDSFDWLSSTPALVVFSTAVVLEVLADKVPWVDHVLDAAETFVRPLAGTLVVAASLTELDPLAATVIGLLVGGTVAGGVHVAKAKTRILSTAATAGLASPVISVAEDGVALVGTVLSILIGGLALVFVVLLLLLVARWALHRRAARLAR